MSNNIASENPPESSKTGDLWYCTKDNNFYIFDEYGNWDMIEEETDVFDIITEQIKEDTPEDAYDRAMGIL